MLLAGLIRSKDFDKRWHVTLCTSASDADIYNSYQVLIDSLPCDHHLSPHLPFTFPVPHATATLQHFQHRGAWGSWFQVQRYHRSHLSTRSWARAQSRGKSECHTWHNQMYATYIFNRPSYPNLDSKPNLKPPAELKEPLPGVVVRPLVLLSWAMNLMMPHLWTLLPSKTTPHHMVHASTRAFSMCSLKASGWLLQPFTMTQVSCWPSLSDPGMQLTHIMHLLCHV